MAEAADAVRRDHAVARDDDRQPVVAARLANGASVCPEPARELAVGERLAARDLAQRVPQLPLELAALDEQRQIELRIGIVAILLELARGARSELVAWRARRDTGRQVADL